MKQTKILPGIAGLALTASIATAGTMGSEVNSPVFHPFIAAQGGGWGGHSVGSQSYTGTDDTQFIYNAPHANNTWVAGIFLGGEFSTSKLPPPLFLQAGLEYNYFGSQSLRGAHTVGIEPQTSTAYTYRHKLQSQQLLASAKILTTIQKIFHPYLSAGLGAAFNQEKGFSASTDETGSINMTPTFDSNCQTAFSYSLGAGVDATLNQHIRLGFGYRFTSLGKASLGAGGISINNETIPVPFSLTTHSLFANQFIAQITYII